MKKNGSILILLLPLCMAFVILCFFIFNYGAALHWSQKIQTLADATLHSSLRIRSKSLEIIASRWENHGQYTQGRSGDHVLVHKIYLDEILRQSQKLKRALGGYKGRISGVIKVVAEANGFKRENIEVLDKSATRLGLEPQEAKLTTRSGESKIVPAFWYKRLWSSHEKKADSKAPSHYKAKMRFRRVGGGIWNLSQYALGRMIWDVDQRHSEIQTNGNGGFPRNWEEAWVGNRLQPHRYPIYEAMLVVDPH